MAPHLQSFSRYLPPDPKSAEWGWQLIDAGRHHTGPGGEYPGRGHPLGYHFDAEGRRTLDEHQIVIVTSGQGFFESRSVPRTIVYGGTALLLFPGEWHRYQPAADTGWSEYWLGFRGRDASRIMETFFSPADPILTLTHADTLIHTLDQLLHWVHQPVHGRDQIAASHIPLVLSFLEAGRPPATRRSHPGADMILQAKAEMLRDLSERTDLQALSRRLGVSYSRFRTAFKKETGHSPREFVNTIKLNRSLDLLLHQQLSVTETAASLGYASVYYFSRAFKKQFGRSPQQWLKSQML